MGAITLPKLVVYLQDHPQFSRLVAFRPTGWTHTQGASKGLDALAMHQRGHIVSYGLPYSEHSSFSELRSFVQAVRPQRILPTVNNGAAASREKMVAYFRSWLPDRHF